MYVSKSTVSLIAHYANGKRLHQTHSKYAHNNCINYRRNCFTAYTQCQTLVRHRYIRRDGTTSKLHHLNKYLHTSGEHRIHHSVRGRRVDRLLEESRGNEAARPRADWAAVPAQHTAWNSNILTLVWGTFNCFTPAGAFITEPQLERP